MKRTWRRESVLDLYNLLLAALLVASPWLFKLSNGAALVREVLIQGMTMEQIGHRRGLRTQRWNDYFARRFRECLDRLALIYGFATERRGSHKSGALSA